MGEWVKKMLYTHNGILFNLRKESSALCDSINEQLILCGDSALKEDHDSPFLKRELHLVTSFQRVKYGKSWQRYLCGGESHQTQLPPVMIVTVNT